jgi:hypothetical protein
MTTHKTTTRRATPIPVTMLRRDEVEAGLANARCLLDRLETAGHDTEAAEWLVRAYQAELDRRNARRTT